MFPDRLRMARKRKNLSQEDLAQIVNTSKANISNYENRHATPPSDMLIKLGKTLEVSIDFLLGLSDQFHPEGKIKTIELDEIRNPDVVTTFKRKELDKEDINKTSKMLEVLFDDN